MDFRVLDPLEIVDRNTSPALGGVKQRSLLAALLPHETAA
jgi:DNA-binding SARP family transcriptional activator